MPRAIVDPEELRRFAHDLKRFNTELHGQLAALHGRLLELGHSWRDQEQKKFAEEFEKTIKMVSRFVHASDQHFPFLLRKAERIDEYLQQR